MRGEWKTVTTEELIDEIAMGPFGSDIKVECFVDEGVPVLNGSNLEGFKLKEESFRYVTTEKADSLKKANALRGDIVVTHRGTLGQIVYIPQDSKFDRYVISQSQFRVKCNTNKVLPEYLVYYFHTRIGQHKLLSNTSQVGVPALARATSTFRKLQVPLPPLDVQRRIAAVLSPLDRKIELNSRMNAALERAARALFKRRFVDTAKGGELPAGWREGALSEIADYLNGLAMQKFRPKEGEEGLPVLKIKELRQGACDENSELCSPNIKSEYVVHDGDVVFSWSGTLLVDLWCGGECGLNQHLFKVTSDKYDKWFYYAWTKHHLARFVAMANDMKTTMGHIKREALDNAKVLIPSKSNYEKASRIMKPLLDLIIANRKESRALSRLRDTLLPRLMSGEIDASKVTLPNI